MASWPLVFALTQAIEVPLYGAGLRELPLWKRLAAGFGASAATHPWVWFVLPPYLQPHLGYWGYVVVVECAVVFAEGLFFAGMGVARRRAFAWALVANVASALAGFGMHARV